MRIDFNCQTANSHIFFPSRARRNYREMVLGKTHAAGDELKQFQLISFQEFAIFVFGGKRREIKWVRQSKREISQGVENRISFARFTQIVWDLMNRESNPFTFVLFMSPATQLIQNSQNKMRKLIKKTNFLSSFHSIGISSPLNEGLSCPPCPGFCSSGQFSG